MEESEYKRSAREICKAYGIKYQQGAVMHMLEFGKGSTIDDALVATFDENGDAVLLEEKDLMFDIDICESTIDDPAKVHKEAYVTVYEKTPDAEWKAMVPDKSATKKQSRTSRARGKSYLTS